MARLDDGWMGMGGFGGDQLLVFYISRWWHLTTQRMEERVSLEVL
jgi:hypothetical protein